MLKRTRHQLHVGNPSYAMVIIVTVAKAIGFILLRVRIGHLIGEVLRNKVGKTKKKGQQKLGKLLQRSFGSGAGTEGDYELEEITATHRSL